MKKSVNLGAKEEKKLLIMAQEGLKLNEEGGKVPPRLKNAIRLLIFHNQNLIKYIARGYSLYSGIEYDDLVSAGMGSLPQAIKKFNVDFPSRFATYAGHWIRQYFQSYINKSQFINQNPKSKTEGKKIIFYDNYYQGDDDNENKTYSLMDTLEDSEDEKYSSEIIRQRDILNQINILVNSLENREEILLIRLLYKVKPCDLLDVYYICTEEEKKELKKMTKLGKKDIKTLQSHSLEKKKISDLPIVENYLALFLKTYNFSNLAKLLDRSENSARKLKQKSLKQLQDLANKRGLDLLIK